MPEDQDRGASPNDPMQVFLGQLRALAEQFSTFAPGAFPFTTGRPAQDASTVPPLPGSLTAAQLRAIAASVAAQRSAISAMSEQLRAFDTQLEVLESILTPLVQWSQTWANAERGFSPPVVPPGEQPSS